MTLTAPDVSSLTRSLSCWEKAEYVACAFVALACAGEYISDFTDWFTAGDELRKKRLAKRSTLLLIVSLAVELFCLVQTNSISGQLIGSLSDKATNADTKAQSALDKSGIAETKADAANKRYDDLSAKYLAAERELTELKAARLPRRLSSEQIEALRKRVAAFPEKSISVFCVNGGKEAFDFEQDFVKAFDPVGKLKEYLTSCNEITGGGVFPSPLQIEAGTERQGDADALVKALIDIGVIKAKKEMVRRPNENKTFLGLTIGPKAP